jgi:hypothetical protein
MRFKLLAAALVTAALAAAAELPVLRTEATDGGSIFFVKNTASEPLTAYLIELVDYPGSYYALFQDELTGEPIAPGAEKRIQVANMTVGAVPDYVKLGTAIYADGSTAGNPDKLKQILERRRALLATTRQLIERLEKAQGQPAAVTDLKQWAESIPAPKKSARSQAAINDAASRALITETAAVVEAHSVNDALTKLRTTERALAQSKPSL